MASLSDPVQRESNKPPIFVMGVLDYQLFQQSLASLVERARKPAGAAETVGTLRALVSGIADKGARDLAATHLDRMESSLSNNRWNRAAAGQILELAGCDLLTISPNLLGELKSSTVAVAKKLDVETAKKDPIAKLPLDERSFRFLLNEDAMATEKLAEGIRLFSADIVKLEKKILAKI